MAFLQGFHLHYLNLSQPLHVNHCYVDSLSCKVTPLANACIHVCLCVCVCAPLTGLASKRATASSQYCPCCPVCSHVFIDQKQLRQHRMKEHRDLEESKWPCTLCTARFQSSSRLNSHVRSQHMHLKPFSCQMCGKAFSDGSNLRTHMALHRGEFCFCTYYSVFHRHFFFLIFLKLYIDTSKNVMLRN